MDYSVIFKKCTEGDKRFEESLKLVRQNSKSKIWLVGGYIFRNLAHALYGTPKPNENDFDFVAEELAEIKLLPGWQVTFNTYGSPKFLKGKLRVDLWPLTNTHSIVRRKLEPTIENYLTGVSFNIQSIVYDLVDEKIIGNIGLNALESKTIAINNPESLKIYAKLHGFTPEESIKERLAAWSSLGFENKCQLPE